MNIQSDQPVATKRHALQFLIGAFMCLVTPIFSLEGFDFIHWPGFLALPFYFFSISSLTVALTFAWGRRSLFFNTIIIAAASGVLLQSSLFALPILALAPDTLFSYHLFSFSSCFLQTTLFFVICRQRNLILLPFKKLLLPIFLQAAISLMLLLLMVHVSLARAAFDFFAVLPKGILLLLCYFFVAPLDRTYSADAAVDGVVPRRLWTLQMSNFRRNILILSVPVVCSLVIIGLVLYSYSGYCGGFGDGGGPCSIGEFAPFILLFGSIVYVPIILFLTLLAIVFTSATPDSAPRKKFNLEYFPEFWERYKSRLLLGALTITVPPLLAALVYFLPSTNTSIDSQTRSNELLAQIQGDGCHWRLKMEKFESISGYHSDFDERVCERVSFPILSHYTVGQYACVEHAAICLQREPKIVIENAKVVRNAIKNFNEPFDYAGITRARVARELFDLLTLVDDQDALTELLPTMLSAKGDPEEVKVILNTAHRLSSLDEEHEAALRQILKSQPEAVKKDANDFIQEMQQRNNPTVQKEDLPSNSTELSIPALTNLLNSAQNANTRISEDAVFGLTLESDKKISSAILTNFDKFPPKIQCKLAQVIHDRGIRNSAFAQQLTQIADVSPSCVLEALARPLAQVSENREAMAKLEQLTKHDSKDVRVEAYRALAYTKIPFEEVLRGHPELTEEDLFEYLLGLRERGQSPIAMNALFEPKYLSLLSGRIKAMMANLANLEVLPAAFRTKLETMRVNYYIRLISAKNHKQRKYAFWWLSAMSSQDQKWQKVLRSFSVSNMDGTRGALTSFIRYQPHLYSNSLLASSTLSVSDETMVVSAFQRNMPMALSPGKAKNLMHDLDPGAETDDRLFRLMGLGSREDEALPVPLVFEKPKLNPMDAIMRSIKEKVEKIKTVAAVRTTYEVDSTMPIRSGLMQFKKDSGLRIEYDKGETLFDLYKVRTHYDVEKAGDHRSITKWNYDSDVDISQKLLPVFSCIKDCEIEPFGGVLTDEGYEGSTGYLRDDIIDGVLVWVLERQYSKNRETFWVNQSTGLIVKCEYRQSPGLLGKTVEPVSVFSKIQINPAINPEVLLFAKEPGDVIKDVD